MRPIGWYVHHHGAGHRARLDAVERHLKTPVVALGSGVSALPARIVEFDAPAAGSKRRWPSCLTTPSITS